MARVRLMIVTGLLFTGMAGAWAAAQQPVAGLDLSGRDDAIPPGDDFWRYANGTWADTTPIPLGADAVGASVQASRNAEVQVLTMLYALASAAVGGSSTEQLVGTFYASWLAQDAVEARGLTPALPTLRRIARIATVSQLEAAMVAPGASSPIAISVVPDPQQPARDILSIEQGALGLPRDYYLRDEPVYAEYRSAYRSYLATLLRLGGRESSQADAILALETRLARGQQSAAQQRNASTIRVASRAALHRAVPGLDWTPLLADTGYRKHSVVIVQGGQTLTKLGVALRKTPLPVWKAYLTVRFLDANAPYLPHCFGDARARLDGALGTDNMQGGRAERGVRIVNAVLGDAVGALYARTYLSPDAARAVREIFDDVRASFRARITEADWMDAPTRRAALEKVDTLRMRLGGPDAPPDYPGLRLKAGDLFGNVSRIAAFHARKERLRLSKPHRHEAREWIMLPQTPNGFYYAATNAITIEAALLQPPFFDPAADPAINYGAIGSFIGHEMGHAFDDRGSRIDAQGRERNWWTDMSRAAFQKRTDALKAQFSQYYVLPGLKLDATLTLGENIADLMGMQVAVDAYARFEARRGKGPILDGFTGEQRVFLGLAQMRRTKLQPDAARQLAAVDAHAPPAARVNFVVRNLDAWYAAFSVRAGARLYLPPDERVRF